ncbi:MAG: stage III sporulation protein AD [Oscillospiraceae bacterium]|nr:stage III sporulation protein AD [Oscillospiraceae bacterium]
MNVKIVSVAGLCITAAVLCKLFGSDSKEYALYIKLAAAAAVMSMMILFVSPIAEAVRSIYEKAGADEEYLTVLFKAMGICYITRFSGDICRDSGESTLAAQTELAGKIALIIIALPLFETLADIVTGLVK